MNGTRAVVVGGGLAGLSAALRLADSGAEVTLLEARPRLGGATHSFVRNGLSIDNGQHVFLRCYDAYLDFLRRIRVQDRVAIQDRFEIPVLRAAKRPSRLFRTPGLPSPLHLSACLTGYGALGVRERLGAIKAALRLRALDGQDRSLDELSFGQWLDDQNQSARSVRALWDLLIVAALNTRSEHASLLLATKVFQTALLRDAAAADIGLPLVPLSDLHAEPARRELTRLGARIHLRTKVTHVRKHSSVIEVCLEQGSIDADVVVVATPHRQAAGILPVHGRAFATDFADLGSEPIVNAHLVFDRQVTDLPFSAAVDSPVQWTFDRTGIAGLTGTDQYLAVSLSAATDHIDVPVARLREWLLPEFARLFPRARRARLTDFFVTRERHATFRQSPGSQARRPAAATCFPGLLIAGAWTDTGWPDTMESAVRSGNEAARLACEYVALRTPTPAG